MGFLDDRRKQASDSGSSMGKMTLAEFGDDMPLLYEMFTTEEFENGDKRVPSSLSVFYDEGVLKLCLNDKQEGLCTFVTCSSVLEGLLALEMGLGEDRLDWRPMKWAGKGRGRRK